MSRHVVGLDPNPVTGSKRTLVYGFDPPLSSYFWQEWDEGIEENDGLVDEGDSRFTGMSNSDFFEKLKGLGNVPEPHLHAIAMDLPF